MGKLVKYHNNLNSLSIRGWSPVEMNIFFSIVSEIRDKGTDRIVLKSDRLREMSDKVDSKNRAVWYENLKKTVIRVGSLYYYEDNEKGFRMMTLFNELVLTKDETELYVEVSPKFSYIVNKLTEKFTAWELQEFTSLRSSYSKTIYRLLKQWKTVGKKVFSLEELRLQLDIPDSYNAGMVRKRVIDKAFEELNPYFSNLSVKIEKGREKGSPIKKIIFTFDPEQKQAKPPTYIPTKYNKNKRQEPIPFWLKEGSGSDQPKIEHAGDQEQLKARMKEVFNEKEN